MQLFSLRREGGLHGTMFNHRQQYNNNQQHAERAISSLVLQIV
jgi:hypothetical protein